MSPPNTHSSDCAFLPITLTSTIRVHDQSSLYVDVHLCGFVRFHDGFGNGSGCWRFGGILKPLLRFDSSVEFLVSGASKARDLVRALVPIKYKHNQTELNGCYVYSPCFIDSWSSPLCDCIPRRSCGFCFGHSG